MKYNFLKGTAMFLILGISSCTLLNLETIDVSTYPSQRNQVIDVKDSIWIEFSHNLLQSEAETLLRISSAAGPVEGDMFWNGQRLIFQPLHEFTGMRRYVLSFKGSVSTQDGRKYTVSKKLPFYAGSDARPTVLESFSPEAGKVTGVSESLKFHFSRPVDRDSFEELFSVSPSAKLKYLWNGNSVSVTPWSKWENLSLHRWTIPAELHDENVFPIAMEYSETFLVQQDVVPPSVSEISPAIFQSGIYKPLKGLGLSNLDNNHDIMFIFNEEVNYQSLVSAFSIQPDIDGHFKQISAKQFVYVKGNNFEPAREYRITIKKDLSDMAGNRIVDDILYNFTAAVPATQITSVKITHKGGSQSAGKTHFNTADLFPINGLQYFGLTAPAFSLTFVITIDQPYSDNQVNAKQNFLQSVNCQVIFPQNISSPTLYSSHWNTSGTALTLQFNNFAVASNDKPIYYRFKILKGSSSSANSTGSYLTEDISFTFHAQGITP